MTTRSKWAGRVRRWRASGLTAPAFGAREGLNPSTLRWWSSQLARDRERPKQSGFVEVVAPRVEAPGGDGVVEIVLRDGVRIRIAGDFDPAVLRRAVAALRDR